MFKLHSICQFGQLILRKIIKILAIRSYIIMLQCTEFNFGWDSASDPAGGVYYASPDLSWILGVLFLMEKGGKREG